jgi:hypothetical protein
VAVTDAGDGSSRWKTFSKRTIYDNPWVWLGQVDVELPDGERFWHHVVRLHRAAMMVLVDDEDQVLLMWRHRFVQNRMGWELPGVWVPKTIATWADSRGNASARACARGRRAGLHLAVRAMIFGLWA